MQQILSETSGTNWWLASSATEERDPRFAYAYMISGCTASSCQGYFLNLVAAAHILHKSNTTADILLRVRMAANSPLERLPVEQEEWLNKSGILFDYMPKLPVDNFGVATLEKFRVLELLEYDRVLFLDSDVLPMCNMDYLFEESYRKGGLLSDFVVLSDSVAPFAGGCFLVTPQKGEFDRVLDIVRRHRNRSLTFDTNIGWGHELAKDDVWEAWHRSGNVWSFYAVASDQGILYHWIRYERLNYTWLDILKMETWREVDEYWNHEHPNMTSHKVGNRYIARVDRREYRTMPGFKFVREHDLGGCRMPKYDRVWPGARIVPFSDYYHFAGGAKPWNEPILAQHAISDPKDFKTGRDVWLSALTQANATLGLGLPSNITLKKGNPLGGADPLQKPHLLLPQVQLPEPETYYEPTSWEGIV